MNECERKCRRCGDPFPANHLQWQKEYCTECSNAIGREHRNDHMRKRKAARVKTNREHAKRCEQRKQARRDRLVQFMGNSAYARMVMGFNDGENDVLPTSSKHTHGVDYV